MTNKLHAAGVMSIILTISKVLAAFLLLSTVGVTLLFITETGTSFIVRRALSMYNSRIPGRIVAGDISGILLNGIDLRDVVLLDSQRALLASIDLLSIRWDLSSLMNRHLEVSSLLLRDPQVHLLTDRPGAGFADLAPPVDVVRPRRSPSLPFCLSVDALVITRATLTEHNDGPPTVWVREGDLTATGAWEGLLAHLKIKDLDAILPTMDGEVSHLDLNAWWDGQVVTVEEGEVVANHGRVTIKSGHLDPFTLQGAVDLEGLVTKETIRRFLDHPVRDDMRFELQAQGDPTKLNIDSHIMMARAQMNLKGAVKTTPVPEADLSFTFTRIDTEALGLPVDAGLQGHGTIWVKGRSLEDLQARLTLLCQDCDIEEVKKARIDLKARIERGKVWFDMAANARRSHLKTKGTLDLSPAPVADLSFSFSRINTKAWGLPVKAGLKGRGTLWIKAPSWKNLHWRSLEARLTLLCTDCDIEEVRNARVNLKARLNNGIVWFDMAVRARGGHVASKGTLRITPTPLADLTFSFSGINAKSWGLDVKTGLKGRGSLWVKAPSWSKLGWRNLQARISLLCPNCDIERVQNARVNLKARLNRGDIWMDANVDALGSHLEATGRIWDLRRMNVSWRIRVSELARVTRAFDLPLVQGNLTGQGSCQGRITAPDCEGMLHLVQGAYPGVARAGEARAEFRTSLSRGRFSFWTHVTASSLQVQDMNIRMADITAEGTPQQIDILANVTVDSQSCVLTSLTLYPGPPLRMVVHGGTGYVEGVFLCLIQPTEITVTDQLVSLSETVLQVDRARVVVEGVISFMGESRLELTATGLNLDLINRFVPDPDLKGWADLHLLLEGRASSPEISFTSTIWGLEVDRTVMGLVMVAANWRGGMLKGEAQLCERNRALAKVTAVIPASLNLQTFDVAWDPMAKHTVEWMVDDLTSQRLSALMRLPGDVSFVLDSSGKVVGNMNDFMGQAKVEGRATYGEFKNVPFVVSLSVQPEEQLLVVKIPEPYEIPVDVMVRTQASLSALLQGTQDHRSVPFTAHAEMESLPLHLFEPLLPSGVYDLYGSATLKFAAQGTLRDPNMSGSLVVKEGNISVLRLSQPITNIELAMEAQNRSIVIKRLAFGGGSRGKGEGSGRVVLTEEGDIEGNLTLTLDDFSLESPGIPELIVSSRITTQLGLEGRTVQVKTTLAKTDVRVFTTSTKAPQTIPTNPNIVFLDEPRKEEVAKGEVRPPRLWRPEGLALELTVTLADPVSIEGSDISMTWDGSMMVKLQEAQRQVSGQLNLIRGTFQLLGNSFNVEQASISFPPGGGIIPFISLSAQTSVADASITMTISGEVTSPKVTFASDPPMPEYQIFASLITGNPQLGTGDRAQLESAAASLGVGLFAFQFPELQRQLTTRIGIDRVGLAFGETVGEPIITVGKRISNRILLETSYHQSPPEDVNRFEARAEFIISPRWILETSYGDANVGDLNVYWRKSFGSWGRREAKSVGLPGKKGAELAPNKAPLGPVKAPVRETSGPLRR